MLENKEDRLLSPIEVTRRHPERWENNDVKILTRVYWHEHELEQLPPDRKVGWICDGGKEPLNGCFSGITDFF